MIDLQPRPRRGHDALPAVPSRPMDRLPLPRDPDGDGDGARAPAAVSRPLLRACALLAASDKVLPQAAPQLGAGAAPAARVRARRGSPCGLRELPDELLEVIGAALPWPARSALGRADPGRWQAVRGQEAGYRRAIEVGFAARLRAGPDGAGLGRTLAAFAPHAARLSTLRLDVAGLGQPEGQPSTWPAALTPYTFTRARLDARRGDPDETRHTLEQILVCLVRPLRQLDLDVGGAVCQRGVPSLAHLASLRHLDLRLELLLSTTSCLPRLPASLSSLALRTAGTTATGAMLPASGDDGPGDRPRLTTTHPRTSWPAGLRHLRLRLADMEASVATFAALVGPAELERLDVELCLEAPPLAAPTPTATLHALLAALPAGLVALRLQLYQAPLALALPPFVPTPGHGWPCLRTLVLPDLAALGLPLARTLLATLPPTVTFLELACARWQPDWPADLAQLSQALPRRWPPALVRARLGPPDWDASPHALQALATALPSSLRRLVLLTAEPAAGASAGAAAGTAAADAADAAARVLRVARPAIAVDRATTRADAVWR